MRMKISKELRRKVEDAAYGPVQILPSTVSYAPIAGELTAIVAIPGLVVVSEPNRRDHWAVKRQRVQSQQAATASALNALGTSVRDKFRAAPTVTVMFTRIGGKKLDTDNLVGAFKAVRDQVARWLLIDDGSDRLKWDWPVQESGEKGIRIKLSISPTP